MATIVQNDSGTVSNANAYIDSDYLYNYFINRGVDSTNYDSEDIDNAIVKATDYVDYRYSELFIGYVESELQTTKWPRKNAITLKGFDFSDIIPTDLKKSICEYSLIILNGEDLSPNLEYSANGQNIKSESVKIGPITTSTTYKDDFEKQEYRKYPKADMYLKDFIKHKNLITLMRA